MSEFWERGEFEEFIPRFEYFSIPTLNNISTNEDTYLIKTSGFFGIELENVVTRKGALTCCPSGLEEPRKQAQHA